MERSSAMLSGSEIVQHHRTGMKELPEVGVKLFEPSGSFFEANKLNNALDERYSLLKEPRIERDTLLSVAKWDGEKNKVVMVKKRGKEYKTYGHHDSIENLDYLTPEEALFLLESNSLTLLKDNVELSLEMGYSLLLSEEAGCTLDRYRVFSHLSRLGYKLIRHKKPEAASKSDVNNCYWDDNMIIIDDDTPVEVVDVDKPCRKPKLTRKSKPPTKDDVVVLIESSDSDDDIEIVDEFNNSVSRDVIQIGDDDSRDSDLVMVEAPGQTELPLENWSYVPRRKFLSGFRGDCLPLIVDALVLSQREIDILDELPNIRGRKAWLYRPEDILIPDGVWPFHFKYLIDLCEDRNNNRGRGGYRGRHFRGRGWILQRQVSQMKDYTISLMNVVSQLIGPQGRPVLPPPPSFFNGPNFGNNRGFRPKGRATWGRISFNSRGSNYRPGHYNETVVLSDDEEETSRPKRPSSNADDNGDVETKRVKLDADEASIYSDTSAKSEPIDMKREANIKEEETDDMKPNVSSFDDVISVKSETNSSISETISIKSETEIKSEEKDKTKNRGNQSSQINGVSLEKANISTSDKLNSSSSRHKFGLHSTEGVDLSSDDGKSLPDNKSNVEVSLSCIGNKSAVNVAHEEKQVQKNASESDGNPSAEINVNIGKNCYNAKSCSSMSSSTITESYNISQNIKHENSADVNPISTNISNEVKITNCIKMEDLPVPNSEAMTEENNEEASLGSLNAVSQSSSTYVPKDTDVDMKEFPDSNCGTKTNNNDKRMEGNECENSGRVNIVTQSSCNNIPEGTIDSNCFEMKELPEYDSPCISEANNQDIDIVDSNLESQDIVSQLISSNVKFVVDFVEMEKLPSPLKSTDIDVKGNSNNSDRDEENMIDVLKSDASKDSKTSDYCESKTGDECKEIEAMTCAERRSETNIEMSMNESLEGGNIVSKSESTNDSNETEVSENIEINEIESQNIPETETEITVKVENTVSNLESNDKVSKSTSTDFVEQNEGYPYIETDELSQSAIKSEIINEDYSTYDDQAAHQEDANIPNSILPDNSEKLSESTGPENIDNNLIDNIKFEENESSSKPILSSEVSSAGDKISSEVSSDGEPMLVDNNITEIIRTGSTDGRLSIEEAEDSGKQTTLGSVRPGELCDKTSSWKEFKENESLLPVDEDNETSTEEVEVEEVPSIKPLIEENHCKSLGDVLNRLQMFGQYESNNELKDSDLVEVKYDVYLPTSNYYRNLPADPDFRLVILNLDDNLPNAEEMRSLRQLYKDKKSFLFAVTLGESIAYYQYDTVFIPVNSDPS